MRKLIVLILLSPLAVMAQKDYVSLMDKYMQAQADVNEFSGSVLIAKNGKILYEKAFGMADREWAIPNTVQTKYKVASITKQFTAACILQLADAGKLSLEDKLSKFFPDFPKADSVTIHMMLNHTSGIQTFTNFPGLPKGWSLPLEKDSFIALFKDKPYEFSPGTGYNYNNSAYFLLGFIIEKVSGQSYRDYLYHQVIEKAGLKNTDLNRGDTILLYRAKGYRKDSTGWKNATFISAEIPYSAGAMISTVEDLYKWHTALFAGTIISSSALAKMTTPYLNSYGYGLEIDSLQNHKQIGHDGVIPGFRAFIGYYPADGINVVALSNTEIFSQRVALALTAILLDIPVIPPYKRQNVSVSFSILQHYAGSKYKDSRPDIDSFMVKGGKLYVYNDGDVLELIPESETKFYVERFPHVQFEFDVNKDGQVMNAYRIYSGIKSEMKKL